MKENESKTSGNDIVSPGDFVMVYGKCVSCALNEETNEWEEDFVEDPILALIEAEMKRQVDDTKTMIHCAITADTIKNGKEVWGQ